MKLATIIKTGYTAGAYGNSGEYFTAIFTSKNLSRGLCSFKFHGQYGAEERVAQLFEQKGYKLSYTQADYGKMTRKDIMKNNYSEYTVEANFEELLKHGYIENF